MANYTVVTRAGKAGIKYRCLVRNRVNGKVQSESRTFPRAEAAHAWGALRVSEIDAGGGRSLGGNMTVRALINKYLQDQFVKCGRSKTYSLNLIADCDIADIKASELAAFHVVQFCKDRHAAGAGAVTVNVDISNLKSVFKHAKALWGVNVTDVAIVDAIPTLQALNLVGRSQQRSRRLKDNEFTLLYDALTKRGAHPNSNIPFADILEFSILSCMRIGEICRIKWSDLDDNMKAVLVRDRKDPRKQAGNHMWVPLIGGAYEIIKKQPQQDDKIFPFNPRSITAAFQRVRNGLGIEGLRYHDLRREGASRLFEKGYSITEVAQVTGHRNINLLWQVYTELNPEKLQER